MNNRVFIFLLLSYVIIPLSCRAQWNADAGLVHSYEIASINASSSGAAPFSYVTDNSEFTYWESASPLPSNYISQSYNNILLNTTNTACTDGDGGSYSFQEAGSFDISLPADVSVLRGVNIKAQNFGAPILVYAVKFDGSEVFLFEYYDYQNQFKGNYPTGGGINNVQKIRLKCEQYYNLYEVAALSKNPSEYITLDLGYSRFVGQVRFRHINNKNQVFRILTSIDNENWTMGTVAQKITTKWHSLYFPQRYARYVRIEYDLPFIEWDVKAQIAEIDVYDENGQYGAMPYAYEHHLTMNDFLGVNGIFGWLTNNNPSIDSLWWHQYEKVGNHARNYHELRFDTYDPDIAPDYAQMTLLQQYNVYSPSGVNWAWEYNHWKQVGLLPHVSLKFDHIPTAGPSSIDQNEWNTGSEFNSAKAIGKNFAQRFGSANGGYNLVSAIEVGNEPWDYAPAKYKLILAGMAQGVKEVDPNLKVLPCALQAGIKELEDTPSLQNYAGSHLSPEIAPYINGFNSHIYSFTYNEYGERVGVQPEHPTSDFRFVLNDIRFMKQNMPDKPVYVTEWGWDSTGGGEFCTVSECVSERAQALYAMRGAMMLARLGVERAFWYFFANVSNSELPFAHSGYVASLDAQLQQKMSFRAVSSLLIHIGEYRFEKVLMENEKCWAYQFKNDKGARKVVAWQPINGDIYTKVNYKLLIDGIPTKAYELNGSNENGTPVPISSQSSSQKTGQSVVFVPIGAAPVVFSIVSPK